MPGLKWSKPGSGRVFCVVCGFFLDFFDKTTKQTMQCATYEQQWCRTTENNFCDAFWKDFEFAVPSLKHCLCQLNGNATLDVLNSLKLTQEIITNQLEISFSLQMTAWWSRDTEMLSVASCPKFCRKISKIIRDTRCDLEGLETPSNILGTFPLSNDAIFKPLRALEAKHIHST